MTKTTIGPHLVKATTWDPEDQYTDATFHKICTAGGWGFIMRDDQGTALAAGAGNLGQVTGALHAEALAMSYAINSVVQMDCDRVMIEKLIRHS